MVSAAGYDIGTDTTVSFNSSGATLTNATAITDWVESGNLKFTEPCDFTGVDFTALGITSWTTTKFNGSSTTIWDGANWSGISINMNCHNFGYNDSMVGLIFMNGTFSNSELNQPFLFVDAEGANFSGTTFNIKQKFANGAFRKSGAGDTNSTIRNADFSNITWGVMTNAVGSFFNVGPGTTNVADKANAPTFEGADLSLMTGTAKSTIIANLGKFDGGTPIGAKYNLAMVVASGWTKAELNAAGWQDVTRSDASVFKFQ